MTSLRFFLVPGKQRNPPRNEGASFDLLWRIGFDDDNCVFYAMPKEFGSQICDRHGIYAVSRALRHSDVGTTALDYLDKSSRATTCLGAALLSMSAERRVGRSQ
jgi:hypothetical protein